MNASNSWRGLQLLRSDMIFERWTNAQTLLAKATLTQSFGFNSFTVAHVSVVILIATLCIVSIVTIFQLQEDIIWVK